MTVPVWAELPSIGGPQDPRSHYVEALRPLIAHPGRRAVIKSGTPSACNQTATNLRHGGAWTPEGHWEFAVRTFRRGVHVGDMNVARLYARYLGPVEDDEVWCGIRRKYVKAAP